MNPKSPPSLAQDEGVGTAPLPHPGPHFQISPSEIIMGARTPHKTRSPTLFKPQIDGSKVLRDASNLLLHLCHHLIMVGMFLFRPKKPNVYCC